MPGFGPGNASVLSLTENSGSVLNAPDTPLVITKQPLVPPSGILQPLPALIGFDFSGSLSTFPLTAASSYAICAGPDGNTWIGDFANPVVWRVTPKGVATSFPLGVVGAVAFSICAGPDGNTWAADGGVVGGGVYRITPAGVVTQFPIASVVMGSICAMGDGNLWASDNSNTVYRITTAGVITPFITTNNAITSICAGPDGDLYGISGSGSGGVVFKIPVPTGGVGTPVATITGADLTQAICTGADGNLWFTDVSTASVYRVTPAGVVTQVPLAGSAPQGVFSGPGGDIWVCDNNGNFWKINPGSLVATPFAVAGKTPAWAAIGWDGSFWITDGAAEVVVMPFTVVMGALKVTTPAAVQTAPTDSHTATTAFGSLAVGTPIQNTLDYDVEVRVALPVTAAVGGSISAGVGPSATPTTDPITPALSAAGLVEWHGIVPAGYWLSITSTGTITIGTPITQVTPV